MKTLTEQLEQLIEENTKIRTEELSKKIYELKFKNEQLSSAIVTICKDYDIADKIIEEANSLQKSYDDCESFWGRASTSLFLKHAHYTKIAKILNETENCDE